VEVADAAQSRGPRPRIDRRGPRHARSREPVLPDRLVQPL
jgi:hypothetical protein